MRRVRALVVVGIVSVPWKAAAVAAAVVLRKASIVLKAAAATQCEAAIPGEAGGRACAGGIGRADGVPKRRGRGADVGDPRARGRRTCGTHHHVCATSAAARSLAGAVVVVVPVEIEATGAVAVVGARVFRSPSDAMVRRVHDPRRCRCRRAGGGGAAAAADPEKWTRDEARTKRRTGG